VAQVGAAGATTVAGGDGRGAAARPEAIAALRARLRRAFGAAADARPTPGLPTGRPEIDALLAGGGLPRGGLTALAGAGATGLLHRLAARVSHAGLVAWLDPADALDATALTAAGADLAGLFVSCPPTGPRAVRAVAIVLQEIDPDLLILDAPAITPGHARWLWRVARSARRVAVVLLAPPAPWLAEAADLVLLSRRVAWREEGGLLRGSTLEVAVARQRNGRAATATLDAPLPRPLPWPAGLERAAPPAAIVAPAAGWGRGAG
jgi:hypothetical protein